MAAFFGPFLALFCTGLIIFGVYTWITLPITDAIAILWLIFACALYIGFWAIVLVCVRNIVCYRYLCALVGTEGLLYCRNKSTTVILWSEIEWVRLSLLGVDPIKDPAHSCKLLLSNGKRYVFDGKLQEVEKLGRIISREVARRKLPQLLEAYQRGEALQFGPLILDQEGMRKGQKLVSWLQISFVRVYDGYVAIDYADETQLWPLVTVPEIPNFFALVGLLNYITHNNVLYRPIIIKKAS